MLRSLLAAVEPRPLLVVLAAVFAGLATLLTVAAAVTGVWMVLMAAVPLALTGGLMWYQGTGQFAAGLIGGGSRRQRRRRRHGGPRATVGGSTTRQRRAEDDPWEDSFRTEARREARNRARREARQRARRERASTGGTAPGDAGWTGDDGTGGTSHVGGAGARAGSGRRSRQRGGEGEGGLTAAEAHDVLDLERTAGEAAIQEAYREKAKVLHPDAEQGSAEAFRELKAAYERLVGD